MSRIAFQSLMRAAAVAFLSDYKADADINLQVYRARPRSIAPPCAFVDEINEEITYTGLNQRQPTATVVVIHGMFDSGEAVDQRDAFVDGFIDWTLDRIHQAAGNTTVAVVGVSDEPSYVPDWLEPQYQRTYYATRIDLEGLALTG